MALRQHTSYNPCEVESKTHLLSFSNRPDDRKVFLLNAQLGHKMNRDICYPQAIFLFHC